MRLPPPQAVFSPFCAKSLLPAKSNSYYYYPGMPYRQGEDPYRRREDELQQQPIINTPPNYYYYSTSSGHGGGGYWQPSFTPESYSQPYTSYNATRKKSAPLNKTWLQEQMDRTLAEKKEEQRKLAMKQLQQKSIADRAKLQVIKPQKTSAKAATASSKGTASSRGGFGPSGSSHATSAAA